ncbi:MAG: TonB-dependent receptor [Burkholderiales bacterium]
MRKALVACLVAGVLPALAEDNDAVVVTASPLGSGLFDLAVPADVLDGRQLVQLRRGSLGETLESLPGMSSTWFGPGSSRPIIRGLDGDRIRILQNGVGTLDASALSFDHAVPYDPLSAERIEVVRGPAAVLHGGSAVGGVVNVIDNRIPDRPLSGFTGRVEPRFGGADNERSVGGVLEAGNGRIALHADGFTRRSGDLRIPGFARSARQRAQDDAALAQPQGRLPNSSAQADGGSLGGSVTWGSGHVGMAYRSNDTNYGSVAEQAVRIDMKSERWDLSAEAKDLGSVITAVRFKAGRTDYAHRELEDGVVNTTFTNKGHDGRIELTHGRIGPMQGIFGLSYASSDFSALGGEAFVPRTHTDARGLFAYEELPLGNWKFSFGGRGERTRVSSEGGGPNDPATAQPRFDPAMSRAFTTRSGAFGARYRVTPGLALTANVSATQRAPTFGELYADGPHAATGVYEIGNSAFDKERSRAFDLGLRWKRGTSSASIGVFRQRFSNFITLFGTGNERGADGELNPVDADGDEVADASGEEILPESEFRAVPAMFKGVEVAGRMRVYERAGTLDVELRGERVHAVDRASGRALPRIAPVRVSASFDYARNRFGARVDVIRTRAQNRVAAGELPTDGYTLVNASLGYRFPFEHAALEVFARFNNLLDREVRYHSSFVKDLAPLGGRSVMLGLRGSF